MFRQHVDSWHAMLGPALKLSFLAERYRAGTCRLGLKLNRGQPGETIFDQLLVTSTGGPTHSGVVMVELIKSTAIRSSPGRLVIRDPTDGRRAATSCLVHFPSNTAPKLTPPTFTHDFPGDVEVAWVKVNEAYWRLNVDVTPRDGRWEAAAGVLAFQFSGNLPFKIPMVVFPRSAS